MRSLITPIIFAISTRRRSKPYLAISDCNVDWGQALKQVRAWLDAHPQKEKTVSLYYFGNEDGAVEVLLE